MKLLSLFDGSGGFCLAAKLAGITPIAASEIEPFPIAVTRKRFPEIEHYGDITKIDGGAIKPVDIVTWGSPCQDLSIAGNRAGLQDGERSNLFYEAIRVIEEMRKATNGEYPKYGVWENVTGAFSSNKGDDFRNVLEAICKIKDKGATVPMPKSKKWQHAGAIVGNGYSIAWRVLDAQYWGVPQRSKRIYLVADFNGKGAAEILFKSEGLSGYSHKVFGTWERCTCNFEKSTRRANKTIMFDNHARDCRYDELGEISPTITASYGTGGNTQPLVLEQVGGIYTSSKASFHSEIEKDIVGTLVATDYKDPPIIYEPPYTVVRRITPKECARLQGFPDWWCDDLGTENPTEEDVAFWRKVFADFGKPKTDKQLIKWIKDPHSDSAEYKMWGNGVALPCVWFVLAGVEWWENTKGKVDYYVW